MSDLASLRKEVLHLRQKSSRVNSLEVLNATLHLTVARLEQENVTLRDAVRILQRKLQEHEKDVLLRAQRITECSRRERSAQQSMNLSPPTLMPSPRGVAAVGRHHSSLDSVEISPVSASFACLRNSSPSPPLHKTAERNARGSALQSFTASSANESISPFRSEKGSMLRTSPKRLQQAFLTSSLDRMHDVYETPKRSSSSKRGPNNDVGETDLIEVSAISSMFSPASGTESHSVTPVAPRLVAPLPIPQSVASHIGSTPIAPSRLVSVSHMSLDGQPPPTTTAALPPRPVTSAQYHQAAQRKASTSRSPSPVSRTSMNSSFCSSIDEELNEGVNQRLSALMFM